MTRKIWIEVPSENIGEIDSCDQCGLNQPDTATAYRQLHYDDCVLAPAPSDFNERVEELFKPRSEGVDSELEAVRLRNLQPNKFEKIRHAQSEDSEIFDGKIRIKIGSFEEQLGFLDSAIKSRNLEFIRLQIDWSRKLIEVNKYAENRLLCNELQSKIEIALKMLNG